jgi:hypothetical protein
VAEFPLGSVTWQAAVGRDLAADPAKHLFTTLSDALVAWKGEGPNSIGVIALIDNGSYEAGAEPITLAKGSRLLVVAADWPELPQDGGGVARVPGRISPRGVRAHVRGSLTVKSAAGSELWLNGLLIEGGLALSKTGGAGLARLSIVHTTLVPLRGALEVAAGHDALAIELRRSICGAIEVEGLINGLALSDSAVVAETGEALSVPEAAVQVDASTIIGPVNVQQLDASNAIFTDLVQVERRQTGCVRFCFVPDGSATPRRYRCQPDLALQTVDAEAEAHGASDAEKQDAETLVLNRVVPDFTDEHYGLSAFLQLSATCPPEIKTGADNGSEMGVWCFLQQPQRETNLRTSVDEYLRLGLETGLIFVT